MSSNAGDPNRTQLVDSDLNRTQIITSAPSVNMTLTIQPVQCPVCKSNNPPGIVYCVECGLVLSSALPDDVFGAPAIRPPCLVEASGREHFLRQGANVVGREGDVLLTDNRVSRKHAEVTVSGAAIAVRDLGSTNGTFLDGVQLTDSEPQAIAPGTTVSFGGVELTLSLPGGASATAMPNANTTQQLSSPPKVEAPVAYFVCDDSEYPLKEGTNTLGRRTDNDIVISDPFVSGSHADIEAVQGEVFFTDVGSTNGTLLNGARLPADQRTRLTADDEITLGKLAFRIRFAED
jgi:pSer/pThr/pTyr-binding forkhead associated (FHA) protein